MRHRQQTIDLRAEHPDWSNEQIGRIVGKTKQGIWASLKQLGLPTQKEGWGTGKNRYHCLDCGKIVAYKNVKRCQRCHSISRRVIIQCDFCKKLFIIRKAIVERRKKQGQKTFFCNHSCQCRYLTERHGFGVHPENMKYYKNKAEMPLDVL